MQRLKQGFFILMVVVGICVSKGTMAASVGSGLSFGIATGSMSVTEERAYLDTDNDLYAEVQVAYDNGPAKLGLHIGYIECKSGELTYSGTRWDEKVSFVPIEIDLGFMPLRLVGQGGSLFQPYAGIGVGIMLGNAESSGYNNKNLLIAPVVRGGVEFYLGNRNIIGIDVAHHMVKKADNGFDYSFTTIMFNYRFRIPLAK